MAKKMESVPKWRLRRGLDRRFRAGHPWAYSNELSESPKGIEPGEVVELLDSSGAFLARGFGNPKSLIAFRALSRNPDVLHPSSPEHVAHVLKSAGKLRTLLGFQNASHRLCFGETDGLPGLVIDRYLNEKGQVFVVQAHTAGGDRWMSQIVKILETYVTETSDGVPWSQTGVVQRNDLAVRKLEGLKEEEPQILRELKGVDYSSTQIWVKSVLSDERLPFSVDLINGQKTGFFLDQFANIQLAALRLGYRDSSAPIRILDLCSYVGQWGTQFAHVFKKAKVHVTAVDASQTALEFAKKNIQAQGASCETIKGDVLKDLGQFADRSFDLVISDPPAFIKSRKDIPQGTHAYLQLNTQVFRLIKKGGGVVCCSCSALLEEESFAEVLAKAARRNQVTVRWVGRGAPSPDHPMWVEFPEGRYLKGWVGRVDE